MQGDRMLGREPGRLIRKVRIWNAPQENREQSIALIGASFILETCTYC